MDVILDFSSGILLFQSYIYTYNVSPGDEFNTRGPVLNSLALLTFLFTAIAIYKSYSPCHEAWRRRHMTFDLQLKNDESDKSKDDPQTWQAVPDIDNETHISKNGHNLLQLRTWDKGSMHYPGFKNSGEKFIIPPCNYNSNLTEKDYKIKVEKDSYTNNDDLENKVDQHIYEKKQIDHSLHFGRQRSLVSNDGCQHYSLYDVSTVIRLLIDYSVIYWGVHHLMVFCKYYYLYNWTLVTYLDMVQVAFVPVIVLVVEITASLARTINFVLKISDENKKHKPEMKTPSIVVFQV